MEKTETHLTPGLYLFQLPSVKKHLHLLVSTTNYNDAANNNKCEMWNLTGVVSHQLSERRKPKRSNIPPLKQNCNPAPPRLQAVLRSATDELEQRYAGELAAHVSLLLLRDGGGPERRRGLTAVTEELFEDGVNWGRIVAMMELGGVLCTEVVRRGGAWQLDDVAKWMEDSLESPRLREWMQENGGWDAFVELYGESRPAVRFWSLRTVFGLAVLGAAGITLGALISWR
uniref:Bcl-2 Bcl-2 homology region 1-3 domain-containing protein n=1 Tax=Mola mola TaxID=94237 RepID=A0A3Q4BUL3_MOLML